MAVEKKIKDRLLEKTADDLEQPLGVVEDIMRWMFKDAIKAFKAYEQVEISGWGTFLMSPAKIKRRIVKLERIKGLLEAKLPTEDVLRKIESVSNNLQYYYSKTNEIEQKNIQADSGRIQKLVAASGENEGRNSQNL